MSTHYKGNGEEIRALDCFIKLMRATESVNSVVQKNIIAAGLTESQFGVLEALLHLGPLNQNQIGQKILKSGGNITLVIDNLSKRGLINKEKRLSDRRCFWISLTEEGKTLIESIFPEHVRMITSRMSVLNADEQAELGHLCRKLGCNFPKEENKE